MKSIQIIKYVLQDDLIMGEQKNISSFSRKIPQSKKLKVIAKKKKNDHTPINNNEKE